MFISIFIRFEVALVYFRAGYTPRDFPEEIVLVIQY